MYLSMTAATQMHEKFMLITHIPSAGALKYVMQMKTLAILPVSSAQIADIINIILDPTLHFRLAPYN